MVHTWWADSRRKLIHDTTMNARADAGMNLKSAFYMSRAVLPHIAQSGPAGGFSPSADAPPSKRRPERVSTPLPKSCSGFASPNHRRENKTSSRPNVILPGTIDTPRIGKSTPRRIINMGTGGPGGESVGVPGGGLASQVSGAVIPITGRSVGGVA